MFYAYVALEKSSFKSFDTKEEAFEFIKKRYLETTLPTIVIKDSQGNDIPEFKEYYELIHDIYVKNITTLNSEIIVYFYNEEFRNSEKVYVIEPRKKGNIEIFLSKEESIHYLLNSNEEKININLYRFNKETNLIEKIKE